MNDLQTANIFRAIKRLSDGLEALRAELRPARPAPEAAGEAVPETAPNAVPADGRLYLRGREIWRAPVAAMADCFAEPGYRVRAVEPGLDANELIEALEAVWVRSHTPPVVAAPKVAAS